MTIDELEDGTHLENYRGHNKRPAPPQSGCDGPDHEAAKEGTGLEDTDCIGVDTGLLSFPISEIGLKRLQGQNTANCSFVSKASLEDFPANVLMPVS